MTVDSRHVLSDVAGTRPGEDVAGGRRRVEHRHFSDRDPGFVRRPKWGGPAVSSSACAWLSASSRRSLFGATPFTVVTSAIDMAMVRLDTFVEDSSVIVNERGPSDLLGPACRKPDFASAPVRARVAHPRPRLLITQ